MSYFTSVRIPMFALAIPEREYNIINKDYRWIAKASQAWSIPGIMFFSVLIGYLFGAWLDGKFSTDPWLTIVFVVLGIGGGFYEVIRIALRISR